MKRELIIKPYLAEGVHLQIPDVMKERAGMLGVKFSTRSSQSSLLMIWCAWTESWWLSYILLKKFTCRFQMWWRREPGCRELSLVQKAVSPPYDMTCMNRELIKPYLAEGRSPSDSRCDEGESRNAVRELTLVQRAGSPLVIWFAKWIQNCVEAENQNLVF